MSMDGGASVRTKDRNKKNAEIERLHEKTFRAWANSQLRVRNVKLENSLAESFHDGLMLIALVEVLSGEKCQGKYHKVPEKDIHKLENITIAIEFLGKFIQVNVNSNDILQGNLKVILGLVWRLILTFQVEGKETEETKDMSAAQRNKLAKQRLLKWCQDTTAGHKYINIENFQNSWFDGMGFCALVHAIDPSLLDYDSLRPENAKENLKLAFELAEKHFDIPQLLDPEDICADDPLSKPDEQCFMTYLSAFPVALLQKNATVDRDAEAERIRRAEEEARRKAEEEAAKRIKEAEEAARRKAEEEAAKREAENEARRRAEEEIRKRKEEEDIDNARRQAKEEAERSLREEEEEKRKRREREEEERRRLEAMDEEKRRAEEERREREFEAERERLRAENERLKAALLDTKHRLIGKLKVHVHEARNFKNNVDAYVTLFLEKQKDQSKTIKKTKDPKWNAAFEFYVSDPQAALELTVFNRHWIFSDDALGHVQLDVSSLQDGVEKEEWFPLKKRKGKKDKGKQSGEIRLTVLYSKEK